MNIKNCWRDIAGYEGIYKVNIFGQVKRIYKNKNEQILKIQEQLNGYNYVVLYKNRKGKNHYIHRLVAQTFIKKNRDEQHPQVNHKNGIKSDNRYWNLEWCSASQNMRHSYFVLKRCDSKETRLKKSLSKRGEKNFFFGKNPTQFRTKNK